MCRGGRGGVLNKALRFLDLAPIVAHRQAIQNNISRLTRRRRGTYTTYYCNDQFTRGEKREHPGANSMPEERGRGVLILQMYIQQNVGGKIGNAQGLTANRADRANPIFTD